MRQKKNKLLIALLLMVGGFTSKLMAQIVSPVKWSYAAKRNNSKDVTLYIKATMEKGWHIYSLNQPSGGPIKTSFSFEKGKDYVFVGKVIEQKPIIKFEKVFDINVMYFEGMVVFIQKIKLQRSQSKKVIAIKGKVEFMACSNEECLPPDEVTFCIPIE